MMGPAVALIVLLPLAAAAQNVAGAGFRLPPDFRPPTKKCDARQGCQVELLSGGDGMTWQARCGQAGTGDVGDRMATLLRREHDVVAIVVSKGKRALASEVLDYLDSEGLGGLVDDGRIKLARMEDSGPVKVAKRMAEMCARPPEGTDGPVTVPNTAFVFIGDKAEAPRSNPCRDDRWRDGIQVMTNLDNIASVLGDKTHGLVLNQRQIDDIKRREHKVCEETGDASAFVELVLPESTGGLAGGGRALSAADIGFDNADVRRQATRLGVTINQDDLRQLKPADIDKIAVTSGDGRRVVPVAALRGLKKLADSRASDTISDDGRKELLAKMFDTRDYVMNLRQGAVRTPTQAGGLSMDDIRQRRQKAGSKYEAVCNGENSSEKCSSVGGMIHDIDAGIETVETEPAPAAKPASSGVSSAAEREKRRDGIVKKLDGLVSRAAGCASSECIARLGSEFAGIRDEVGEFENAFRPASPNARPVDPRLARLDRMLGDVERGLSDLGREPAKWSKRKIAAVATMSAGGLMILAGIVPLAISQTYIDDIDTRKDAGGADVQRAQLGEETVWSAKPGDRYSSSLAGLILDQRTLSIVGYSMMGVGAAAVIIGGALLAEDMEHSRKRPVSFSVDPVPSGLMAGISGSF